jgi:hypothetical protein
MIALVTCRNLPEPDVDEQLLLDAVRERGMEAEVLAWDDPDVDWSATNLQVLRSTWNYHLNIDPFVRWTLKVGRGGGLWNLPSIIGWNVHKRYLLELTANGIPTVPTIVLAAGTDVSLAEVMDGVGWHRAVVKPAISAGSHATITVNRDDVNVGDEHLAAHLHAREMLVQPYIPDVEVGGERSLVWIGGGLTHAVRKQARFAGDAEHASSSAVPIADDERELAERVMRTVGVEQLYARVDMVRDASGTPMLMELELIEPSLFLLQHRPAADAFADAIVAKAADRPLPVS